LGRLGTWELVVFVVVLGWIPAVLYLCGRAVDARPSAAAAAAAAEVVVVGWPTAGPAPRFLGVFGKVGCHLCAEI